MTTLPEVESVIKLKTSERQMQLVPLVYDRFWRFGLDRINPDYAFCKDQSTAPLRVSEFSEASASYPIVFLNDNQQMPCAVMGLAHNINLALTHKNSWRNGLYQPLEYQMYPFGFINLMGDDADPSFSDSLPLPSEDGELGQKSLLAIDPTTPMLVPMQVKPEAISLYNSDGSITAYVTQAISMQGRIRREQMKTASFVSAMRANNLFVEKSVRLHFKDGSLLTVSGFSVISKTALSKVSPVMFERWKEMGYLDYIQSHWNSLKRWAKVLILHERRMARDLDTLRLKKGRENRSTISSTGFRLSD